MAFSAAGSSRPGRSAALNNEHPSLTALLEQARKLQSDVVASPNALPSVALGLDQIESQSRSLAARAQHELAGLADGAHGRDLKAQYLLSGAAVNTDAVSNHLDRLDPANAFIQLQPVHDNDVEGLLRQAHEATIINVIEESRKAVLADFYQSLRNDVHTAWEHQKQAVFDELARFSGSGDRSEASTRSVQYSSSTEYGRGGETYSAASGAPPLQMRLLRYNRVLEDLDARRKEGSNFDLIDAFAAVDADQAELRRSRLPMLWRLISHLVRTDAPAQGDGARHVPERHFASAYAAADDSPEASELRARLTRGALSYLEEYFFSNVVEKELAENPNQAQLGGVPSVVNKIAAYVRLQRQKQTWPELEQLGGTPVWAHIYFLLRSGHSEQAVGYAREHDTTLASSGAPDFVTYFSRWVDSPGRRLGKQAQEAVSSYYYARLRHNASCDPFKLALYKLLSRADLAKKRLPAVTDRTEDWFWLQLSLVRESNGASSTERWSLLDLGRDMTTRYTSENFGPAYVQLLLLCGQFERAVAHLYSKPAQHSEAVHLAIALSYYGLLRLPPTTGASAVDILTIEETSGRCHLDLVRILARYYRSFAQAAPVTALHYICLIPLAGSGTPIAHQQLQLAQQRVTELVLETDAYSVLLGDVGRDGTVIAGAIAQVAALLVGPGVSAAAYVRSLTREVARRAETDKRFSTTVLLYHLADEHENVMHAINAELGLALTRPPSKDQTQAPAQGTLADLATQDPAAAARSMLQYYRHGRGTGSGPSSKALRTCEQLLGLRDAFAAFEQGQLDRALQCVAATALIPLDTTDITAVMRKVEDVKEVDEAITHNLGDILRLTMETLYRLHSQLKESPWGDAGRQAKMNEYRLQARSLMTFAGMLRFRLTGNVYEQLSRLDCFLH